MLAAIAKIRDFADYDSANTNSELIAVTEWGVNSVQAISKCLNAVIQERSEVRAFLNR